MIRPPPHIRNKKLNNLLVSTHLTPCSILFTPAMIQSSFPKNNTSSLVDVSLLNPLSEPDKMMVTETLKILFDLHELHCMCVCVSRINAFFCLCNFCVPLLFAVLQTLFNFPRKAVVLSSQFPKPKFHSHTKTASSMSSLLLPLWSHPISPLCSSPVRDSCLSALSCVFSTVSFCHFAPKVANVQLGQSFQRSIHTQ